MKKDIAVIGVGIRCKNVSCIEDFRGILQESADLIGNFPENRIMDTIPFFNDAFNHKANGNNIALEFSKGAFLDRVDEFDHQYFKISPAEAQVMDPNQRIFLETAMSCLINAGYGGNSLKGSKTGVFVGFMPDFRPFNYKDLASRLSHHSIDMLVPPNLVSIIPTRISYFLDFRGPTICLDTSCSSSLVAVHQACLSILNNECDQAIAGGIKLNLAPFSSLPKPIIESPNGYSRVFDCMADGIGIGEGSAAILLKPLEQALIDKNLIYGVIKGSAINQDGRSTGLACPNANAQSDVLIEAWKNAEIDPNNLGYIEAHGTGTRVGDPIEIQAITVAFEHSTKYKQFCAIGSVKANIGHLYEGAGIFGFIKALASVYYGQVFPQRNFERQPNKVDLINTPLYIPMKLEKWETFNDNKRLAGVSAFGLSGTNCHIVIEEFNNQDNGNKKDIPFFKFNSKRFWFEYPDNYLEKIIHDRTPTHFELEWTPFECGTLNVPVGKKIIILHSDTERQRTFMELLKLNENEIYTMDVRQKFNTFSECQYPDYIIHLATLEIDPIVSVEQLTKSQDLGMFSLYSVLYDITRLRHEKVIEMILITEGSVQIDKETLHLPENATLTGLGKIIQREFPKIKVRAFDVDSTDENTIIKYFTNGTYPYLNAIRNGQLYTQCFSAINFTGKHKVHELKIKTNQTYLITGGTGGLGLEFAKLIAEKDKVNLLLLSKTGLVLSERKTEIINQIKRSGSSVEIIKCDIGNEKQCLYIENLIKEKYGKLSGILHAAGVPGSSFTGRQTREEFESVSKPKIEGSFNLASLAKLHSVDFFILYSSVATYFPAVGQGDYCAANSYLEAYAIKLREEGIKALCVSWVAWLETGMAFDLKSNVNTTFKAISTYSANQGLIKAFEYDISNSLVGSINFSADIASTLLSYQVLFSTHLKGMFEYYQASNVKINKEGVMIVKEVKLLGRENNVYSDVEAKLANIWGSVLGYDQIDIRENIYNLGADSLMIAIIVSDCEDIYNMNMSVFDVMNFGTIENLAESFCIKT
ncbi:MAG: SDR family NAD(P)-dependent oxidoreductase [Pyrinomonadaceae bacterium]|nr:SDR family NAD(P)-dependent oxidoreductase [Sphingobacteriaceae bacterium]